MSLFLSSLKKNIQENEKENNDILCVFFYAE